MIKIGHLSVAFLPRNSEPAGITCQTTVFTVLAFLFRVSVHSQPAPACFVGIPEWLYHFFRKWSFCLPVFQISDLIKTAARRPP